MSDEISTGETNIPEGVAFINIFHTPDQEGQIQLIQSLAQVTEEVIRYQPGFLSASLHKSLDGKTVTNVARWHSAEDFKRALETPGMLAHREVLRGLYPREGYLGQVVYTYANQESDKSN
jgi:heme-degrading monooxygenase HmoA